MENLGPGDRSMAVASVSSPVSLFQMCFQSLFPHRHFQRRSRFVLDANTASKAFTRASRQLEDDIDDMCDSDFECADPCAARDCVDYCFAGDGASDSDGKL